MKRYTFHIDEKQLSRLENLPGNVSEHLRGAINDYLEKFGVKSSTSPSVLTIEVCVNCGQRMDKDDEVCPKCKGKEREVKTLSGENLA